MKLGKLITFLEKRDPRQVAAMGFHLPHSYRGQYDELAFVSKENVTVGQMLETARGAVGVMHVGYKGGSWLMSKSTVVNLVAEEYYCSPDDDELREEMLREMLGEPAKKEEGEVMQREKLREELLGIAEDLDGMSTEVTNWEADFLDTVLKRSRLGLDLSAKQEKILRDMKRKYRRGD